MEALTCEKIQAQIIELPDYANLPAWIHEHVRSCTSCHEFANTVAGFEQSFSHQDLKAVQPVPWVLSSLEYHIKLTANMNHSGLSRFFHWIRELLNRRIPVYQAALSGVLLLIVGLIIISGIQFSPTTSSSVNAIRAPMDSLLYQQLGIIYSLDVLREQNVGCSVSDDSSLTQYLQAM